MNEEQTNMKDLGSKNGEKNLDTVQVSLLFTALISKQDLQRSRTHLSGCSSYHLPSFSWSYDCLGALSTVENEEPIKKQPPVIKPFRFLVLEEGHTDTEESTD